MCKVSVIIPTYNGGKYLSEAIQSVLDQSYSDFEIIVVENGLTNGSTQKLIKKFGDSRIHYHYLTVPNRSIARNWGIQHSQGKYIAFLDDDDRFLSNKLADQISHLKNNSDTDLVAGGAILQDNASEKLGSWHTWQLQPELNLRNCLYNCPLIPSTILVKRQVLARLDHWFDPEFELAEDKDFFIRLLHAGCKMDWLPKVVSVYRVHEGNSQGDGAKYSKSYQKLLDKLFAYDDISSELKEERNRLSAHFYILGAMRSYANGQVESAQNDLARTIALEPELIEGNYPKIVELIANFSGSFHVSDPKMYIDFVFENLPDSLFSLRRYRREAKGFFYMSRVFEAQSRGAQVLLKDCLLGVWYAPRWLKNRGVISLFLESVLGRRVMSWVRDIF